jgi:mono/diheme cytochrome c family protein
VASALSVCVTCHADPPIGGAVGSLLTYTDLKAAAPNYPGMTMAQMAVTRMQDTAKPMPPAGLPAATSAQIATLSTWIAAGYPMGTCGADAGPPDTTFTGAPTCPSGSTYVGGDGSRSMDPGQPCISCHATTGGEAPTFTFAGTVFANGHATDDCTPSATEKTELADAEVIITGANNATITLPLSTTKGLSNGNFSTSQSVPLPYTAKVVYFQGPNMGKERDMVTPQMSGDCNSCHTVAGTNNAPGRIALPQ